MPYIVKTRRRIRPLMPQPKDADVLSDVAVATLDEAREKVGQSIIATGIDVASGEGEHALYQAAKIPEQGGKVSLPDGTTVEVEETTSLYLAQQVGGKIEEKFNSSMPTDVILAAYNATRNLKCQQSM